MRHSKTLPTHSALLTSLGKPFIHRDLSWLQFNDRVLNEAVDSGNPLFERAKFLAISSSNLDEFFTIRFASLSRKISQLHKQGDSSSLRKLERIRSFILRQVQEASVKQSKNLLVLRELLKEKKINLVLRSKPNTEEWEKGREYFIQSILPQLPVPSAYTSKDLHSLGNLQSAVFFSDGTWIPIPKSLPTGWFKESVKSLDGSSLKCWMGFLDDLILSHLSSALGLVSSLVLIRLTRDGDFTLDLTEEDSESIPDVVKTSIGSREEGRPTRLQFLRVKDSKIDKNIHKDVIQKILAQLKLDESQSIEVFDTLYLHGLWPTVHQVSKSTEFDATLLYPLQTARIPKPIRNLESSENFFLQLKARDILFRHPYDSFDGFVNWVQTSCRDSKVESIDLTVYRMDVASPIIDEICKVAKTKRVRVVIELRARFDEYNNLQLAERLRSAGVLVYFGFGKLKIHAKIALISRKEEGQIIYYTHLSTGNYNAQTARQYTDLAILTANSEVGLDALYFFDSVAQKKLPESFKKVFSAPGKLHRRILHLIESEIRAASQGKDARVFAKVNALVDEAVVEALYRASQAGVKVDLVVRGACSIIPGVLGMSENIRVISIVDRYLEHSRIYYFQASKALYLSSADWMPRNFFSRLELAFPVLDERIFNFLKNSVIPTYLSDNIKARELTPEGGWVKLEPKPGEIGLRSQFYFQKLADEDYENTALKKQ